MFHKLNEMSMDQINQSNQLIDELSSQNSFPFIGKKLEVQI